MEVNVNWLQKARDKEDEANWRKAGLAGFLERLDAEAGEAWLREMEDRWATHRPMQIGASPEELERTRAARDGLNRSSPERKRSASTTRTATADSPTKLRERIAEIRDENPDDGRLRSLKVRLAKARFKVPLAERDLETRVSGSPIGVRTAA